MSMKKIVLFSIITIFIFILLFFIIPYIIEKNHYKSFEVEINPNLYLMDFNNLYDDIYKYSGAKDDIIVRSSNEMEIFSDKEGNLKKFKIVVLVPKGNERIIYWSELQINSNKLLFKTGPEIDSSDDDYYLLKDYISLLEQISYTDYQESIDKSIFDFDCDLWITYDFMFSETENLFNQKLIYRDGSLTTDVETNYFGNYIIIWVAKLTEDNQGTFGEQLAIYIVLDK